MGVLDDCYYVCIHAQKHGWSTCPAPSVSAGKIERFVVEQISKLGRDAELVTATFQETQRQLDQQIEALHSERKLLKRQIRQDSNKSVQLAICGFRNDALITKMADLDEQVRLAKQRLNEIRQELAILESEQISEDEVSRALADFESLWKSLASREQAKLVELLIERIDVHGADNRLDIIFRPNGIKSLVSEREEVLV